MIFAQTKISPFDIFVIFFRLGCTSFGGPVAHLGYFHEEFVVKRQWIQEQQFADLVAICQFLPGPVSSQIGMAIGMKKAGIGGALFAWLGFTLPSAIIMILFGMGISHVHSPEIQGFLHGIKIAAVVVVAFALYSMATKLCPDRNRATIAGITVAILALWNGYGNQVVCILVGGILGAFALKSRNETEYHSLGIKHNKKIAIILLSLFFLLLVFLPIASRWTELSWIRWIDSFYRIGSLVFGGGHVVLPLLKEEIVSSGWLTNESFMVGYGLAQTIPGPMFSIAGYLGSASSSPPNGIIGGILGLVFVFLPAFLLIIGILPFWEKIYHNKRIQTAMDGVNAVVVGLLLAAFYDPVWTSAISNMKDFSLFCLGGLLISYWKTSSWKIVAICCILGNWIY
jgi:chromate transporter